MNNWKTTAAAVLAFLAIICTGAASLLDNDPNTNPDFSTLGIAATTAFGLLLAKDAK